MAERYFITRVQLGMLIVIKEESERQDIVNGIIGKQSMDFKKFKEMMGQVKSSEDKPYTDTQK